MLHLFVFFLLILFGCGSPDSPPANLAFEEEVGQNNEFPFEDGIAAEPNGEARVPWLSLESEAIPSYDETPYFSPIAKGKTKCLKVGMDYLVTFEVRKNADGTCYENPNYRNRLVHLFKHKNQDGLEECFATLWSSVFGLQESEACGAGAMLTRGATTCNGLVGPGCAWHDDDRKFDFLFIRLHDGGYTQNGLIHDTCMAYNFYDPHTFVKLEGFKKENNPIGTLVKMPVDSAAFRRNVSPNEVCVDEFSWGIYDVTGISPNVYGFLPIGVDYILGVLAVLYPGRGPGDRCDGTFDDADFRAFSSLRQEPTPLVCQY